MPFNYNVQTPQTNLGGLTGLVDRASASPLNALGNTMSELDAIVTQRGKEEYSSGLSNLINQAKTSQDLANVGIDPSRATPELNALMQQRGQQLSGLDTLAQQERDFGLRRTNQERALENMSYQNMMADKQFAETQKQNEASNALKGLLLQSKIAANKNKNLSVADKIIQKDVGERLVAEMNKQPEQIAKDFEKQVGDENLFWDVGLGKKEAKTVSNWQKAFMSRSDIPADAKTAFSAMTPMQKAKALARMNNSEFKEGGLTDFLLPKWAGGSDYLIQQTQP